MTNTNLYFIIVFALSAININSASARNKIDFGSDWKFKKTPAASSAVNIDDSSWETIVIPHTWNGFDAQDGGGNYSRTVGWYRKHLQWDSSMEGKSVYIELLAASLQAEVFLNGTSLGIHKGGYNAFRFDLTKFLQKGDNLIAIKVDNRYADDIAPLSGDFSFMGGIYRKISLIITDPLHVDLDDFGSNGLYLTTSKVSSSSADIEIKANVVNSGRSSRKVILSAVFKSPDEFEEIAEIPKPLFDVAGMTSGTTQIRIDTLLEIPAGGEFLFKRNLTIRNPRLWNGKSDPYRYQVLFKVIENNNTIDEITDHVGFRYFSVDETGFYLNGKLYPLRGVNRHQDWKNLGYAISEREHRADFGMIYEIGANAVRMAHYPQDPYFHELFDKYGIIVWVEIPFVDKPGTNREAFWLTTKLQLKEMIRQRYNHPSIIFWGLQNEVSTSSYNDIMPEKVSEWHQFVKEEDPTGRLTAQAQAGTARPNWTTDVFGQNRYPGWYQSGTYGDYLDNIRSKYTLNGIKLPIGLSEYGAGGNPGQHSNELPSGTTVPPSSTGMGNKGAWHPEEYQSLIHELAIKTIEERPWIWGTFVWNMFDFASDSRSEGNQPGINDKGLVTHDRKIKKDAFYAYKAIWNQTPMVYITSRRYSVREEQSTPVTVYTNCDSVRLYVNDQLSGTIKRTNRNLGILKWNDILLPNVETPDNKNNGVNKVIALGFKNGKTYSDTVIWNCTLSSVSIVSSTTHSVDNILYTIALNDKLLTVENCKQYIHIPTGASYHIQTTDGQILTQGNISAGMQLVVTAENTKNTTIYTFIVQHIAYKKGIIANASQSGNPPSNVLDGNTSTRWAAPNNASSGSPHYVIIDLEQDYVLNNIAIYWYNDSNNSRAYKYTVSIRKDGESSYSTIVNRSNNTQTEWVNDNIANATGRYIKVNITGSTNSSIYSYPSIWEVQLYGWMISSNVYTIDLANRTICIPEPESILETDEFVKNISFQGNLTYVVSSGAYYITDGATLTITDSGGKETLFTIYFKGTNSLRENSKMEADSKISYYNLKGIETKEPEGNVYIIVNGKKNEKRMKRQNILHQP